MIVAALAGDSPLVPGKGTKYFESKVVVQHGMSFRGVLQHFPGRDILCVCKNSTSTSKEGLFVVG